MHDLISRQAAIDAVRKHCEKYQTYPIAEYDVEIILNQLPSAQPERCDYCTEDSDGFVKPIEKNSHAFIRFGMDGWELSIHAKGWHGNAKIRYCPMCGRRLKNDK